MSQVTVISEAWVGKIDSDRPIIAAAWERCCVEAGIEFTNESANVPISNRRSVLLLDLTGRARPHIWMTPPTPVTILLIDIASARSLTSVLRSSIQSVLSVRDSVVELRRSLLIVMEGGFHISDTAASLVLGACSQLLDQAPGVAPVRFTPREVDVIQAMVRGQTGKATARSLGISLKTVETHRTRVFVRLGVRSHGEALAKLLTDPALSSLVNQ